ncbi:MFS transporter [Microvirga guangxiensis]|uniref:Predicted arabinose efflux permease, MFS family n=1 Tax=Microvirga guangxiensis TaxID=549386 RepID=A0A1G5J9P5_9HYPH|nr:MFS transporter [Microvirga guangxiensis]SCY84418.1 Predicted arabinose efflux permease, MFS family [Microvirga guangxiensis]
MQAPSPISDALAKRNAIVLAIAMALGGSSPAIVVSLGGLVGMNLAENKELATLPVSLLNLGLALGTIPAAILMRRAGRRIGYIVGGGIGLLGGCLAAFGIASFSFMLFCLGTLIIGMYGSFNQSYRFAATDTASEAFKPRAISWVMTGGLVAGVIGPQTVIWLRDAVATAPFSGAFLGQAALALLSMVVVSFLRPAPVSATPKAGAGGRPLSEIVRQPRFIVAAVAGLVSYALMSFLMTAAPIAMVGCGLPIESAALGIQWHILAMFGPSFFTGRLIVRFGKERVTAAGLVLIAVSAAIGLSGIAVAHFWATLIVLGIGWNFGFIGATAMVTDCYRPEERTKVQAANDFLVFGSVAAASFSSGKLLNSGGWETVNWMVFPPVVIALLLLAWQYRVRAAVPA